MSGFFSSMVVNGVVVYPVTKQILTARKRVPSPSHRKLLAALFLLLVGLTSNGVELYNMFSSKNAFRILNVPRTATEPEIRKAYKVMAVELHPDKNPDDPTAADKFMELKEAYDKLLNKEYRMAYDKWGDDGTEWLETNSDIATNGAIRIFFTYAIFASITFLITITSSQTNARSIALATLGAMSGLEGTMRFSNNQFAMPLFPWLAVHQLIDLMHRSYYTFVSGLIAFQNLTYINEQMQMLELVKLLVQQNQQIVKKIHLVDQELRITGKSGGLSKKGGGVGVATSTEATPTGDDPVSGLPRNLQAKIKSKQPPTGRKKARIPNWVFMVGIYLFFNYIGS